MKYAFVALLGILASTAFADVPDSPDIGIPQPYIALIKTTDFVEVTGTNDSGGRESFTIHNARAIADFVKFLTSERFNAVPKDLKPDFKSKSTYQIRLSCKGAPVLDLRIIADSILDLPAESSFYMETDRHSDNFMAPLLRLR